MTIKELYKWAKEKEIENYTISIQYIDYVTEELKNDDSWAKEDITIDKKYHTIFI